MLLLIKYNMSASFTWTWMMLAFSYIIPASFRAPATMFTATTITKDGCQQTCGNLTIPYPFGINKKECAMGNDYVVNCTNIDGTDYAVYYDQYTLLLDISETELTITATPAALSCGTQGEEGSYNRHGTFDSNGKPYALSSTANKFLVTGCHHYGLIEAKVRDGRKVVSCVALCTKKEDLLDSTCSGLGCCEAPIPKGILAFNSSMEEIVYNTNFSSGNCSYAFIAKPLSINFHQAIDLQDPKFQSRVKTLPAVLDWFIVNATCQEVQKSATYACQKNTDCIDLEKDLSVQGYRCKCHQGYEGNPYLSPGCTDIDECKESTNSCSDKCVNTPGSYECHCPKGHSGDGRKDGTGCLASNLKLVFPLGNRFALE